MIIANPNGIDCDGCGFINTSKVDLVTGTANFSGDDFTGFSIDGSSTLTVSGSGFLSDAVADELKLESQNISINAQVRANNSLEIIVNNYTQSGAIDVIGDISIQVTSEARLDDNASIQSSNLFFSAYDFYNQADLTIEDNATFDIGNDFQNGFRLNRTDYDGGDISADNFNVTAGNNFYNRYSATIHTNNFNVVAGYSFYNYRSATINADSFNVTAGLILATSSLEQSMRIALMLLQEITFPIMIEQQSMRIALMLLQEITFPMMIIQQSMRIALMLQQIAFTILQQLMRMTSMLQQKMTFTIGIVQQSMRITSILQ